MKEPESGLSFKLHLSANKLTALLVRMTDFVFRNELLLTVQVNKHAKMSSHHLPGKPQEQV